MSALSAEPIVSEIRSVAVSSACSSPRLVPGRAAYPAPFDDFPAGSDRHPKAITVRKKADPLVQLFEIVELGQDVEPHEQEVDHPRASTAER